MRLALDDYKTSIEKYNLIRVDFERKLADSCNQFQYAEETHLKQMRSFVDSYSRLISNINSNKQQIFSEFFLKFNENFTVEYLLQLFIENKRTGTERPEVAQFIESPVNPLAPMVQSQPPSQNITLNESEFNLVLNTTNTVPPIPPPISPLSYNHQAFTNQSQTQSTDLMDNRNGDYSLLQNNNTNSQSRATPTFFTSSSLYSQLTNSASNTTLNTLSQIGQGNSVARSSPINQSSGSSNDQSNIKRNDSKGLNIFNVDFLGRKNKEKKAAAQKAALNNSGESKSKFSRNKKSKQTSSTSSNNNNNQYENLNTNNNSNQLNLTNPNLSISNASNKDSSSINSEDSNTNELTPTQNSNNNLNNQLQANPGSVTARSISSMTGSLSFDLLDQYKISNGSDVDSEGYSLRPDSSMDIRSKANGNLKNDDMNNYYGSSSTSSDSDSDSDGGDGGPVKV